MPSRRDIYGPDLAASEAEGKRIADMGMKCMQGVGTTSKAEASKGSDASKTELDKLLPDNK